MRWVSLEGRVCLVFTRTRKIKTIKTPAKKKKEKDKSTNLLGNVGINAIVKSEHDELRNGFCREIFRHFDARAEAFGQLTKLIGAWLSFLFRLRDGHRGIGLDRRTVGASVEVVEICHRLAGRRQREEEKQQDEIN